MAEQLQVVNTFKMVFSSQPGKMILEVKTICNVNADFFLFKSLYLLISGSASARSSSATAASFRPVIYLDDDDHAGFMGRRS